MKTKEEVIRQDRYIYSELKEDLQSDLIKFSDTILYKDWKFINVIGYHEHEFFGGVTKLPEETVMLYIVLMLECVKQKRIIPDIKDKYLKLMKKNELETLKEEFTQEEFEEILKDIDYITKHLN